MSITLLDHYHNNPLLKQMMHGSLAGFMTDADAANIYFLRQLEEIDKRLFRYEYAELPYLKFLSLVPGIQAASRTYTWRLWQTSGQAMWGEALPGVSYPKVGIASGEVTSRIRSHGIAFDYSIMELREAAMANVPLEMLKTDAARRGIAELQNKTALFGSEEYGFYGLFNLPDTQSATISQDEDNATKWIGTKKTTLQIYQDVANLIDQVQYTTLNIEKVKRVLMPLQHYQYIKRTSYTPGAGGAYQSSILEELESNYPEVEFDFAIGLETAGATSSARIVGYDPSEDHVGLILPIQFEMFAPVYIGTGWDFICHARQGDVICRRPQSVIYGDGI